MKRHRIAIGSIFTECNQLGGVPIDISWFKRYELCRGGNLLQIDSGVVGGILKVLKGQSVDLVPLIYASTCPGGPLTSECYTTLKTELVSRLKNAIPVNGVILPLHGAAAAEGTDDLEGDLIKTIRETVGPDVPIVATLDLHAHVTNDMIQYTDALIAWETYPHRDSFTTGIRGAALLLKIINGQCRPTMAMAKVPVITSAVNGSTEGEGPFARLLRIIKSHEEQNGVLSTSLFLVHPNLDQPNMGSGPLFITDNDIERAVSLAKKFGNQYWSMRFELEPEVHSPKEAIARGLKIEGKPVLLIEASDCCGGGSVGDSVASLKALIESGPSYPSLVPVVDPEAASICHQAGIGSEVTLSLGHKLDRKWGQPVTVIGQVLNLSNGCFQYTGGMWDGIDGNMGKSAVFVVGAIQILITTHATYDWADEQYRSMQMIPSEAKFVVVKNPMNYHISYGKIAVGTFILDTPGPTPATMRNAKHKQIELPYFPAIEDIPELCPIILQ